MCGIAGYFGQGNREILEKMTDTLTHRGPDTRGFYNVENVGLGHRRLSIIDLSPAGHQPMANEDKTVWIAFNGEIYNFQELKKTLKEKHIFKSGSDTEVILHLYEEQGAEMFKKLQGMFAIALYDKNSNKIILARDRMGKKPLYFGVFNNTLIFGSELKALMKHPVFKKELDISALNKYLLYEYIPTPGSIFKNVHKLEPGHYLEFDGKNIAKTKFWEINFDLRFKNLDLSKNHKSKILNPKYVFNDTVKELDLRLNNAVNTRLVSDVPLGIFLSGGIDSSTIAYYAQKNSSQKIKTFSIGFKEASFDESFYARLAAKYLDTEHYEKILSANDSLELIPKIADLLDEPMADPSIVPTYLLSKFTREHVTVALGGDGGDELFCGYDTFIANQMAFIYEKLPEFLRKNIIEKIALNLPTSLKNFSFDFKAKKFIEGFYGDKKYREQRWLGSFDKPEREKLFLPEVWKAVKNENEFSEIDMYLSHSSVMQENKIPPAPFIKGGNIKRERFYQDLILFYLRMYMMDDILVKVDRASMFNSLEVRAPFLDTEVVDFVNSLPIKFKLHGLQTKYILKKLMADKLPREIVYRPKKGFGMPIGYWLKSDLKPLVIDMLSEEKIKNENLFNYDYIKILLNDHFSGRKDNRKPLWTLLMFEMWMEKWNTP